jgi:O-antigen ligase
VKYFFSGLKGLASSPIFGLGLGGFELEGLSGRRFTYSHSSITETLVSTGIPGFSLYLGSQIGLYLMLRRLRKLNLPRADRVIVNMVTILFLEWVFFSIFAVMIDNRLLWPLLGAFCGYATHLKRRYEVQPFGAPAVPPQGAAYAWPSRSGRSPVLT